MFLHFDKIFLPISSRRFFSSIFWDMLVQFLVFLYLMDLYWTEIGAGFTEFLSQTVLEGSYFSSTHSSSSQACKTDGNVSFWDATNTNCCWLTGKLAASSNGHEMSYRTLYRWGLMISSNISNGQLSWFPLSALPWCIYIVQALPMTIQKDIYWDSVGSTKSFLRELLLTYMFFWSLFL